VVVEQVLMAAIQVYFLDAAQLLGLLMNAWFYLTPIVYPLAMIPEWAQGEVMSNPLAILVKQDTRSKSISPRRSTRLLSSSPRLVG
jgi:ABC-type polysaccharide/polyol phosphate export permease